jgi:hypothetical protein
MSAATFIKVLISLKTTIAEQYRAIVINVIVTRANTYPIPVAGTEPEGREGSGRGRFQSEFP